MFLVSSVKFNDEFTAETDQAKKAIIHADWTRTIRAIDTAVTNDFGNKQSRVRLFADPKFVQKASLGGAVT
ncbi:hypothetical protein D5R81_09010 [Parashewanella spongiae]|uniref:Uncharacterized protein n=2 Tax=Parashewanella spongiae TaxID=342950 RepID=A0A3A6TUC5_9GAMM|nr:hypothetical protein [Parashewanella spongiae]MCL1077979.1 hypothetical protein [Parashewanella spongiae]RJY16416.1 hypothetical protein D5R81_09010 [Parashewanella spongiae]